MRHHYGVLGGKQMIDEDGDGIPDNTTTDRAWSEGKLLAARKKELLKGVKTIRPHEPSHEKSHGAVPALCRCRCAAVNHLARRRTVALFRCPPDPMSQCDLVCVGIVADLVAVGSNLFAWARRSAAMQQRDAQAANQTEESKMGHNEDACAFAAVVDSIVALRSLLALFHARLASVLRVV